MKITKRSNAIKATGHIMVVMNKFLHIICLILPLLLINQLFTINPVVFASDSVSPKTYDEIRDDAQKKARFFLEAGRYKEAIEYFTQVVKEYPEMDIAYHYLGLAAYAIGNLEKAEESLTKAVELNPYHPEDYYYLALIEFRRDNKKKVLDYLNKTTELSDTFQKAYYNKGVVFLSIGMAERALQEFSYALYLEPKDTKALAGIFKASSSLGLVNIDEEKSSSGAIVNIMPTQAASGTSASTKPGSVLKEEPEASDAADQEGAKHDQDTGMPKRIQDMSSIEDKMVAIIQAREEDRLKKRALEKRKKEVVKKRKESRVRKKEKRPIDVSDMKLFLATEKGEERIPYKARTQIKVRSLADQKGILTIKFSDTIDLRDRTLQLDLRGLKGDEKVKIWMRNTSARRSPPYRIRNIKKTWKPVKLNLDDIAYTMDLDDVEFIRIEIVPPSGTKTLQSVFIKNIAFN